MLQRARVHSAINFKSPDIAPLEYHTSQRGLYEHGEKLRRLFIKNEGDFGPITQMPIPIPDAKSVNEDGTYHEFAEDAWGTTWEYRIFCIQGHPAEWPLEDIGKLSEYALPAQTIPEIGSQKFVQLKKEVDIHKEKYFYKAGWISILEKMHALRRFEDVLMDILMDTPEINAMADMIVGYHAEDIKRMIALGADAVQFGDDYGSQASLLMCPNVWRKFFKPRLARLIAPIREVGIKVCFHSCGYIKDIIDDFKEIGVDVIWPQLALYDNVELAKHLCDINLAMTIHIDRANVMTGGTPEDVKKAVDDAVRIFKPETGGSWFYVEIDNRFPYENIQAFINAIGCYR